MQNLWKGTLNMTFKIAVDNAKTLLDIFTVINVVTDEATLQLTPEGIKVCHMDPSRVAMINSETPKTVFAEYQCEAPIKLAVNLVTLIEILKLGGNDKTILEQTYNKETNGNEITVQFNGPYKSTFILPILTASMEEHATPQSTPNVKVSLATGSFNEAIEKSAKCDDHFTINADNDTVTFTAKGDLLSAEIIMTKVQDALLLLETRLPSKATYSLNYLSAIVKAGASIADTVELSFSNDMPIKLDFGVQIGKAEFWLAPRIETED